ncbi:hypothetical protein DB30_02770 [Enhygromyxa salina]|uniref:Uncharacterized protein n=1 Tax=Enhygromyxa salina TaxID=215803 RepID=A0A0C1ZPC8_9BACT|nr:hypothetical protein DB30_02770 [Enhygromyxa salina]
MCEPVGRSVPCRPMRKHDCQTIACDHGCGRCEIGTIFMCVVLPPFDTESTTARMTTFCCDVPDPSDEMLGGSSFGNV